MTRFSQFVINLLRVGLGVALLAWVIHVTGGVRALESLVTVPWLVPAFALQMAFGAAVEARRLGWLAQALDVRVPFAAGYRLVAVGTLFNNAIPGGTGGDLMKLYYLASENRSRTVELAALLVIDRVVGLFSLLAVVVFLALVNGPHASDAVVGGLITAFLIGMAVIALVAWATWSHTMRAGRLYQFLITKAPFHNVLARALDSVHAVRRHPKRLAAAILLSAMGQLLLGGTFALVGTVLMPGVPHVLVALLALLGLVANWLPLTPGGLGVGEAAFAAIFALVGHSGGARMLLAWRVGMLPLAALGAVLYVRGRTRVEAQQSQPGPA